MVEEQALTELADLLYPYLPASGAVYTFGEAARDAGVGDLWPGVKGSGFSKLPAVTVLLENTLNARRNRFCDLVLAIVRGGLRYRSKKGNPVTAPDLAKLNDVVARFGFKIPELWDPAFLASLPPGANTPPPSPSPQPASDLTASRGGTRRALDALRAEFLELHQLRDRQVAGLRLERLLEGLFALFGLNPNAAFRIAGEQIDGSLEFAGDVYLLEAKWTTTMVNESELLVFRGKIEGKSQFTRGLFVSVNGYTREALAAITKGKSPNFVMLDGSHLYRVLEGNVRLDELLCRAVRHLAETGEPYLPINKTS